MLSEESSPADFELNTTPPDEDYALSHAYWFMVLSNGETIYQDDDNPNKNEQSTWLALKRYMTAKRLRVNTVVFKFRSNEVQFNIQPSINWIYLSRGLGKEWTADAEDRYFIIGWQNTPTTIQRFWYKLPELIEHRVIIDDLIEDNIPPEFIYNMPTLEINPAP